MTQKRIVFTRSQLEDEFLFVTLYQEEQIKQMTLLNMNQFFKEENCTIYHQYKNYLKEMTAYTLRYIDFLPDERGVIFHYDDHQQIEYHYTYFSLHDPFFRYLMNQFIDKEPYHEKLKILTKNKKSDTL